jgi:hypothetical protein
VDVGGMHHQDERQAGVSVSRWRLRPSIVSRRSIRSPKATGHQVPELSPGQRTSKPRDDLPRAVTVLAQCDLYRIDRREHLYDVAKMRGRHVVELLIGHDDPPKGAFSAG